MRYKAIAKHLLAQDESSPAAKEKLLQRSGSRCICQERGKGALLGGGGATKNIFSAPIVGGRERTKHPTQKPLSLMSWLVRLVVPIGGTVLDPFAGSGTTLLAAVTEGRNAIGIEREPEYCDIIRKRMAAVQQPLPLA